MAAKATEEQKPGPKTGAYIQEKNRIEEFLKNRIKETFTLFTLVDKKEDDKAQRGQVKKEEIPYIMRYLGQFPSEVQVAEVILPSLMEENDQFVSYERFEPYMLTVLKEKEFEPDDSEILLAAFKKLDPEGKGFIEIEMLKACFEKDGIKFNEHEMKEFIAFATNNADKPTQIYYEDYIQRLVQFVEKHTENLYKGIGSNWKM